MGRTAHVRCTHPLFLLLRIVGIVAVFFLSLFMQTQHGFDSMDMPEYSAGTVLDVLDEHDSRRGRG